MRAKSKTSTAGPDCAELRRGSGEPKDTGSRMDRLRSGRDASIAGSEASSWPACCKGREESGTTRSGADVETPEQESERSGDELPGVRKSKAGDGKPDLTVLTTKRIGPRHAMLCEGREGPGCKKSGTANETSNLARVSASSAASSQAEDLMDSGTSELAKSNATKARPGLAHLRAGRNNPGQECPRVDATESRCKKSGTSMESPERALPGAKGIKPKHARLLTNKNGSILAKSNTTTGGPMQERDRKDRRLSKTTKSRINSSNPNLTLDEAGSGDPHLPRERMETDRPRCRKSTGDSDESERAQPQRSAAKPGRPQLLKKTVGPMCRRSRADSGAPEATRLEANGRKPV